MKADEQTDTNTGCEGMAEVLHTHLRDVLTASLLENFPGTAPRRYIVARQVRLPHIILVMLSFQVLSSLNRQVDTLWLASGK